MLRNEARSGVVLYPRGKAGNPAVNSLDHFTGRVSSRIVTYAPKAVPARRLVQELAERGDGRKGASATDSGGNRRPVYLTGSPGKH